MCRVRPVNILRSAGRRAGGPAEGVIVHVRQARGLQDATDDIGHLDLDLPKVDVGGEPIHRGERLARSGSYLSGMVGGERVVIGLELVQGHLGPGDAGIVRVLKPKAGVVLGAHRLIDDLAGDTAVGTRSPVLFAPVYPAVLAVVILERLGDERIVVVGAHLGAREIVAGIGIDDLGAGHQASKGIDLKLWLGIADDERGVSGVRVIPGGVG